MQGRGHRAYQPVFQNAHTSDTAFIEVDPVLHQGLDLNVQGHLLEEREEDALEVTAVLLLRKMGARTMDIHTPPRRPGTQSAKRPQSIGAEQGMWHLRD